MTHWCRILLVVALSSLSACGGSEPFCGDGAVDEGEQCDDGNSDETDFCRVCRTYVPPRTVIKWAFNKEAVAGFGADGCLDLDVALVEVELTGPASVSDTGTCSFRQVVFTELPAGTYTARLSPKNAAGELVSTAPYEETVVVAAEGTEHEVVLPPTSWPDGLDGSFYYRIRWEGADCEAAGVATQKLTLAVNGHVVTTKTQSGVPLDGTPVPCAAGDALSTALAVPFGFAMFTIEGRDAADSLTYQQTFDTFVGAGVSNPEFTFDVAALPPPADAGF